MNSDVFPGLKLDRFAQVGLWISLAVIGLYLIVAFVIRSSETSVGNDLSAVIDCSQSDWAAKAEIEIEEISGCPNAVEITLAVREVLQSEGSFLKSNITLYPAGSFGGNVVDGAWALRSLTMSDDGVGSNEWFIPSNSLVGTEVVEVALQSDTGIIDYPLDTYGASWMGIVADAVTGERVPVVQTASLTSAPGYDVTIQRGEVEGSIPSNVTVNPFGRFSYEMKISRDPAVKFQVLLLVFATIIGVIAALTLTAMVLSQRRPPSIAALSWLATFLFALLEVRRNYPGNPPIGVRLDSLVTIPVVSLIMSLIVLNTLIWLKRDDWDLKNRRELQS